MADGFDELQRQTRFRGTPSVPDNGFADAVVPRLLRQTVAGGTAEASARRCRETLLPRIVSSSNFLEIADRAKVHTATEVGMSRACTSGPPSSSIRLSRVLDAFSSQSRVFIKIADDFPAQCPDVVDLSLNGFGRRVLDLSFIKSPWCSVSRGLAAKTHSRRCTQPHQALVLAPEWIWNPGPLISA